MVALGPLGGALCFLGVAQVAFAITILVLIAQELYLNGTYTICNTVTGVCAEVYWDSVCLMDTSSINVCAYGYATAAIGILFSLPVCFAACLPAMVSLALSAISSIWWLAFAITATVYAGKADNDTSVLTPDGYPRGNYRRMVYALAWTTFVCCLLALALAAKMRKVGKKSADDEVPAHKADQTQPEDLKAQATMV